MDQATIEAYLRKIRQAGDAPMRPCGLVTEALRPIPAQRVGIAHLFLRPRFLLADPTGSGKTPMASAAYGYLKEKDLGLTMLVVTTKAAQFQWQGAIHRFLQGVSAHVIGYDGHDKLSPAARTASYLAATQRDVWITTYRTMATDVELLLAGLTKFVLVFDEAQTLKNYRTTLANDDRTHLYPAALRLSHKARCCWGLSATPQKNDRLDEIYSVMEVIRPGTFGSFQTFRKNYYILKLVKPMWKIKGTSQRAKPFYEIVGTQNLDHLHATIDPFYLRRPFEVFGANLPTVTFEPLSVELEPKQRKLYEAILDRELPGAKTKIAQIAAFTHAQQALSAPSTVNAPEVPSAKERELVERLKGPWADEKVLVYSKYVSVVDALRGALQKAKITCGYITGETAAKHREATRQRFNAPESGVNVCFITDAGGEALDLQAARVVCFYDLPWSHGNFVQVMGRARRIGSQHPNVLVAMLVAAHTLDDRIQRRLVEKETMVRDVIRQGQTATDALLAEGLAADATDLIDDLFASLQPC